MSMVNRKLIRRGVGSVLTLFVAYFLVLLIYGWSTDWEPAEQVELKPIQPAKTNLVTDSIVSFVTWNVGYGGLGAESDFFYDDQGMWYSGSSMIRTPEALVKKNIAGAIQFFKQTKSDFFLLQEVDISSKRSYHIRQFDAYCQALPDFAVTMAENYRCNRVPIPLLEPWHAYGDVASGLGTFCRYQPALAIRFQLPGHYPMPNRMFQLDRCAALHRFPTNRGHDLVVINVHNAAYDPGDKIKAIQLPYLRDLALAEYAKGNYVVIGGDWNQCPPFFDFDRFMPDNTQGFRQGNIPAGFFPETWRFAYDPGTPSNRKCRDPYLPGHTFVTLIDFFLVSPNVQVKTVKGIDQGFQFSDHQPVWLEVQLL